MSTTLHVLGCSVFVVLGIGHAGLMLFTTKFEPRDAALLAQLQSGKSGMSTTGNMWKGIKGFHLSHSLGMAFFGGFYITLATENSSYLESSLVLNVSLLVIPAVYIALAQLYWFHVPRNCFIVATCLLAASMVVR